MKRKRLFDKIGLNKLCPTCYKRHIVVDNGCAICLFFRSDTEQERFYRVIHGIFEAIPEAMLYDIDRQTAMVIQALPYICTYKAQHKSELHYFIKQAIENSFELHEIVIEEPVILRLHRKIGNE